MVQGQHAVPLHATVMVSAGVLPAKPMCLRRLRFVTVLPSKDLLGSDHILTNRVMSPYNLVHSLKRITKG